MTRTTEVKSEELRAKNGREKIECEECGEEIAKGNRRRRCIDCGKLVCPWCMHHIHELNQAIRRGTFKLGSQVQP